MSTQGTILITGATGKTGAYTVPLLIERGHKVRAFVHREDDRSNMLKALGAEIVVGDLRDLRAVTDALTGVETAYFCYPIAPGLVEATAYFAQAARDANLRAIVNMSQISARRDAESDAARQHWIAERVLDWSGIPTTHLRPTFFAEWLSTMGASIAAGVLALPFGDGRHAPIAAEDQAHVIAAILAEPARHAGQTYPLFGPVEMNEAEIAAELTAVLGHPVLYQPIEIEQFAHFLRESGRGSPHLIQHLSHVAIDYREGRFAGTNGIVKKIGGLDPMTVRAFVEKNRAAFAGTRAA